MYTPRSSKTKKPPGVQRRFCFYGMWSRERQGSRRRCKIWLWVPVDRRIFGRLLSYSPPRFIHYKLCVNRVGIQITDEKASLIAREQYGVEYFFIARVLLSISIGEFQFFKGTLGQGIKGTILVLSFIRKCYCLKIRCVEQTCWKW